MIRPGPRLLRRLADWPALPLTLLYLLAVGPLVPEITTPDGLAHIALSALPLLAVALGQTVVLIAGGIDLSVTATIAASSVGAAWVMTGRGPASIAPAIVLALAIGLAVGLFNGASVAALRMPPFLVTLSTTMIVSGAALWATRSANIANLPEPYTALSWGRIAGVVPPFIPIVVLLALAVHLLLARTVLGRWLYAIGHNPRAARVSGVPVASATIAAYAVSGLCAAVAGLLYTARLENGSPTMGRELLLDVVGATVIGGTSLLGGRGRVAWTVLGVFLFALIDNTLDRLGLEYFTVMVVKGAVILAAASLDLLRDRLQSFLPLPGGTTTS